MAQHCDECGKYVNHIHRNFFGRKYCITCYTREFISKPCTQCGKSKRLLRSIPDSICNECLKRRPCLRCGRIHRPIGKLTKDGPVCNSCSLYYRPEQHCEKCGKPSKALSRNLKSNDKIRICNSCRNSEYKTCQRCRRYRPIFAYDIDGYICRKCKEIGYIKCPECNDEMPAGRGKQCELCYKKTLFKKRVLICLECLETPEIKNEWITFSEWLLTYKPINQIVSKINRYIKLFQYLDSNHQKIPSQQILASELSITTLRRYLYFKQWLTYLGRYNLSELDQSLISDTLHIQNTLNFFPFGTQPHRLINTYYTELELKKDAKKLKTRTIRQNLSTALKLLKIAVNLDLKQPNTRCFKLALKDSPGIINTLKSFAHFLETAHSIVIGDFKASSKNKRVEKLEATLIAQLELRNKPLDITIWVQYGLEYFHGVSPQSFTKTQSKLAIVKQDESGILVKLDTLIYWLPYPNSVVKKAE